MKTSNTFKTCLLSMTALFVFFTNDANAQTWKANIPTWHSPQDVITIVPSSNSATYTFNNYNNWTTLEFDLAAQQNMTANKTVTFGLQSTSTSLNGMYLAVQMIDATNTATTLSATTLLSIPAPKPSTPTVQPGANQYSIDFSTISSSIDYTHVKGLVFLLYTNNAMTTSPNNLAGNLIISNVVFGNGVQGVSLETSAVNSEEWELETNGYLVNSNNKGVIIGSPTTNNVTGLISYPYYSFIVNGRTNFIGNDNAIGIWSNTTGSSGYRHYIGITNATFPSTTTEYSMINANEWNGQNGNPKNLILQNFAAAGGNVGIGQFNSAPLAKLQVNGKVLIGTTQPASTYSGYSLAVAGQIVSQSIVVTTPSTWADFVFKKSYKLSGLNEQENYIQKHGHLEGVPSEKEVMENGYDVSSMDAKLLRKIEELYLYTIELQKTVDDLKKQLDTK